MTTTINQENQSTLSIDRRIAEAISRWEPSILVADYGRLELYRHDYHWLLCRFLENRGVIAADCEVEFYPAYMKVESLVIPYDVTSVDTEREELVVWLQK